MLEIKPIYLAVSESKISPVNINSLNLLSFPHIKGSLTKSLYKYKIYKFIDLKINTFM